MDWKRFSVLGIASLALAACVPQQKYDDLLTAYRGQEQQLLAVQSDLQTSRANEERLRAQLAALTEAYGRQRAAISHTMEVLGGVV